MATNTNQSSSGHHAPIASDPLSRLRGFRNRADRARGIGDDLLKEMKLVKKISKAESEALSAWMTVVPDTINDFSSVSGIKAGKLIVVVPSASHRHVAHRWLASGGLGELQSLSRVPIRGVELKIDPNPTNLDEIRTKSL